MTAPAPRGHLALAVAAMAAAGIAAGLFVHAPNGERSRPSALVQLGPVRGTGPALIVQPTAHAVVSVGEPGIQAAGIWSTPAEFAPPE